MDFRAKKLSGIPSFGDKLKSARENAELSSEKVAQLLNCPPRYLYYLENGEIDKLPPDVYNKGFLRKYVKLLELDEKEVITEYEKEAQFARHLTDRQHQSLPHLATRRFVFTPKTLGWLVGGMIIFFVAGYLFYELHFLISPPQLEIFEPAGDLVVETSYLSVKGQTEPGAKLTINNETIKVDLDGRWSQEVVLSPGLNILRIVASNRFNKQRELVRQVMLK
ncbi:MAG: helix-turn-helix domain-containing protein [Patescibacteria group bacterium]